MNSNIAIENYDVSNDIEEIIKKANNNMSNIYEKYKDSINNENIRKIMDEEARKGKNEIVNNIDKYINNEKDNLNKDSMNNLIKLEDKIKDAPVSLKLAYLSSKLDNMQEDNKHKIEELNRERNFKISDLYNKQVEYPEYDQSIIDISSKISNILNNQKVEENKLNSLIKEEEENIKNKKDDNIVMENKPFDEKNNYNTSDIINKYSSYSSSDIKKEINIRNKKANDILYSIDNINQDENAWVLDMQKLEERDRLLAENEELNKLYEKKKEDELNKTEIFDPDNLLDKINDRIKELDNKKEEKKDSTIITFNDLLEAEEKKNNEAKEKKDKLIEEREKLLDQYNDYNYNSNRKISM